MAEEQKHNIMTAESLKKLQERYDYLLNVKRKEIINAIEIARGFGDLSENAEYTEARNDHFQRIPDWRCPAGQDCRRYCGRGNSARHAAPAHCGHPSLICPIFASDLCAGGFASAEASRGHENRRSLRSPP